MDPGHEATEQLIAEMEKKVRRVYRQAVKETQEKLEDYYRRFEIKDETWRQNVADGRKTEEEYKRWRIGQLAAGRRWDKMKDELAQDLHNANVIARSVVEGYRPEAYAINHDYGTYEVEKGAMVDTSYTLYNRQAVERILREEPNVLPPVPGQKLKQSFRDFEIYRQGGDVKDLTPEMKQAFDKLLAEGKDVRWQKGQIQSVTMQSILQGESIPNMSRRIAQTMGEINHKATIRYARTAVTGAENAGRRDAFERAERMGIDMEQEWRATLDMRTRHSHRQLDGERRSVGEPFSNGCEYPGDPNGPASEIWNCRCSIRGIVAGLEPRARKYRSLEDIEGMSYEEWRESKVEKPHRITKQEEIAEIMRRRYIREDYGGNGRGKSKSGMTNPPEAKKEKEFTFIPAKTIEEAEQYISQYVDKNRFGAVGVSYKGVSVDVANEINKTIGKFHETFNVEKFGGIIAPAGNTKYGKLIENATAAYSEVRASFLLNRKTLKTMSSAEAAFKREYDAVTNILTHPEKYDFSRASNRLLRIIENSKESGRGTIPQTIEEAINHELGHSLEKTIKKSDQWAVVTENMPKYNHVLSGYACENISEYIAESFCSYMKGEGKCDPALSAVFDALRR